MSFPKRGNVFPSVSGGPKHPDAGYAAIVSDALRADLGGTHRAVKTLTQWTGANNRSAKNWLAGTFGPNGDHIIVLLRKSDAVLTALLSAAGRHELLDAIPALSGRATTANPVFPIAARPAMRTADNGRNAPNETNNEDSVHCDVTINVPGNVPRNLSGDAVLNERQHWFLAKLTQGINIKTGDIQLRWGITDRTAKRDIADLKNRGLIVFWGARKTGVYRLSGHEGLKKKATPGSSS